MYPATNSMPTEDEFKDIIDRVVITADFEHLARLSGDS